MVIEAMGISCGDCASFDDEAEASAAEFMVATTEAPMAAFEPSLREMVFGIAQGGEGKATAGDLAEELESVGDRVLL